MTRLTVSEIHAGTHLEKAPFLLAAMNRATDRNGDVYLKLTLRDKSGDIEARYWRVPPEVVERLSAGSGVAVSGNVSEYRGSSQVIISDIQTCQLENMDEYLPVARRPHQEMVDDLQRAISSIKDPPLRQLLKEVLGDQVFLDRFFLAPAAKMYHHACVGGLMEHSLDVMKHVVLIAQRNPEIDRDLAKTVALLHDIGKVDSYELKGTFDLTDQGRLLGHVYIGAALVEQAISRIEGFPDELRNRVLHAILSHHGELAKGAPVTPRTPEALAVHHADHLDADVRGWIDHVEREQLNGVAWTSYSNMHSGELFVGYGQDEEDN